ncbi:hypothetical protein EC973_005404 [Apophysomyces ossiformis]|uniref:Arrestin C-terminal-like domain-containing protein n=1 Tax=Apophysomyces ossiformis TaxID=679940 RepID=A0A8H7BKF4_9FUNG|nr:hypothetical protein EC973_005404 [Apophysomyces ossiformis]
MRMLQSQSKFYIHIENDTLILQGSPEESVGCVLRGCLVLQLDRSTRLKSVGMQLLRHIQWNEGIYTLTPGEHRFPFELVLPGDLAESTEFHPNPPVSYRLKAVAERPAFLSNFVARHALRIIRQYHNRYDALPMRIANEWENRVKYDIRIPRRVYFHGETIVIDISIIPMPGIFIRYVAGSLKEYLKVLDRPKHGKVIGSFHNQQFSSHKSEQLVIPPRSSNIVSCDTNSQSFKIEHKLKFTMSLINTNGQISKLYASMPIIITREDDIPLPAYDTMQQPQHPPPYDRALPALICNSADDEEEDIPLHTPDTAVSGTDYFRSVASQPYPSYEPPCYRAAIGMYPASDILSCSEH